MGRLTVKLAGIKDNEINVRGRVFRTTDGRSSTFASAISTNRAQELAPGTYDIEVETAPARIYKNIKVAKGRETVEDLGRVTGTVEVKGTNAAKKPAAYPVKILYEKTSSIVVSGIAGRPIEVVSGVYDVQVASLPRQTRKGVRIDPGKEVVIDVGGAGSLKVKVLDESGKEVRSRVNIKGPDGRESVAMVWANKPVELLPGSYNIEIGSAPVQSKNDIKVEAGEETMAEFTVKAPQAPVPRPAPAAAKK
jgi:hypothetical protein